MKTKEMFWCFLILYKILHKTITESTKAFTSSYRLKPSTVLENEQQTVNFVQPF